MSSDPCLVSIRDVKARWAYTEITQSHFTSFYNHVPGVESLRRKRANAVPFADLSESERSCLSLACEDVRGFFMLYLRDVRAYRIEQWKRNQLLKARVPPAVSGNTDYPLIAHFIFTSSADAADARNAHKELDRDVPGDDPLTLGLYASEYVLGDGYHRCKRFLMTAAPEHTIAVFVPIPAQ